jgi:hypothetical protein
MADENMSSPSYEDTFLGVALVIVFTTTAIENGGLVSVRRGYESATWCVSGL